MPDKEYTIERLESGLKTVSRWCRTDSLDDPVTEMERAMSDALALLKEPGAVKPIPPGGGDDPWFQCGACGCVIEATEYRYCPWCGRAVKWDDA